MKVQSIYHKRAILLEANSDGRYLVVSDLHIGFEEKFRASGVRIESGIDLMATELELLIEKHNVTDLVIAGDVKSGIDRILESEWENVPKFFSRLSKLCRIHVVPGNHDGGLVNLLPENVFLEDVNGMLVDDTLILHGHTRPLVKFSSCKRLIMGHAHPILRRKGSPLSGKPVWVFLRIPKWLVFREVLEDPTQSLLEVIMLPSFNLELSSSGYLPETEIDRRSSSLSNTLKKAEDAVIITLSGEVVGDASMLSSIL